MNRPVTTTVLGKDYPTAQFDSLPLDEREARKRARREAGIDAALERNEKAQLALMATRAEGAAAIASQHCSHCEQPAQLVDDTWSLCRDCYQEQIIKPMLDQRDALLASLSALDSKMARAIKAFRPAETAKQIRYVCHFEGCRYTTGIYLDLMAHEDEHEWKRHFRRVPKSAKSPAKQRIVSAVRRASKIAEEDL